MRKEIELEIKKCEDELEKGTLRTEYFVKGEIFGYYRSLDIIEKDLSGKKYIDEGYLIKYKDCEIAIDGKVIGRGNITFNTNPKPVEPCKHENKILVGLVADTNKQLVYACKDCGMYVI